MWMLDAGFYMIQKLKIQNINLWLLNRFLLESNQDNNIEHFNDNNIKTSIIFKTLPLNFLEKVFKRKEHI